VDHAEVAKERIVDVVEEAAAMAVVEAVIKEAAMADAAVAAVDVIKAVEAATTANSSSAKSATRQAILPRNAGTVSLMMKKKIRRRASTPPTVLTRTGTPTPAPPTTSPGSLTSSP
jgi:hypothetical protein